jgi:DNA-directed RNA polymerase subunit RPC12/RpoP
MRVELACSRCGRNRFTFPPEGTDSDVVKCGDCGHEIGTLASLKERVAMMVLDQAPR